MKYLQQFGIILAVSFIGELLNYAIPLSIPASIYGLVLMFVCLCMKWIKLEDVKETAVFLIEIMPLMFIPAAVGLITSWNIIRPKLLAYAAITVISTLLVMLVSGYVTDWMLKVEKKYVDGRDIGYVGDIKSVDTKILHDLMEQDFLPIVYPIGMDDNGDAYNINADEAASAIATALKAEKLAYLSDVEGVRRDPEDPSSVISELYVEEAEKLVKEGVIKGGMLPKIRNCIEALKDGVSRIHIMDGRIPHSLLLEFFTNKGIGTAIIQESEEKYWNE